MANISISIPDAQLARVIDGVAGQYGYQASTNGIDNPETKAQFCRRMLSRWVKESVMAYEAAQAAESARVTAIQNAESQITIS